jgi:hypothetical protein
MDPTNYFDKHVTKCDYDRAFEEARLWALGEGLEESGITAARIFHVKEETLRKSIYRTKTRQRNSQGMYNTFGGNNKVLNEAQEEAIRQYCYEQWELGLGATHKMVFAAICHLKEVIPSNYLS